MIAKILVTIGFAPFLLAALYAWLGRDAAAETGQVLSIVLVLGVLWWAGWASLTLLWLVWTT